MVMIEHECMTKTTVTSKMYAQLVNYRHLIYIKKKIIIICNLKSIIIVPMFL